MNSIVLKVRDLIEDNYKYEFEVQEYYGGSKIFTLQNANIDVTSLVTYKNGVLFASSNYTYDANTGQVTVTGTLVAADNLKFTYNSYEKYSDNEIRGYIRSALYHLTAEKYKTFVAKPDNTIFPTPNTSEEALIAIIASLLVAGSVRSYKTPEFAIQFEEGISTDKKIKQAVRQFNKAYGYLTYIDPREELTIDD